MSLSGTLSELRAGLLDLVFAPACVACRGPVSTAEPERVICRPCWSRVRPLPEPRCPRCWEPLSRPSLDGGCPFCARIPPRVRVVRSAFLMEDPAREMVHALKYLRWAAAARPMGARMAALAFPEDVLEEVRYVVPVPTSRSHLRRRGYNQAELLAAEVARRMGAELRADLLLREGGATQTNLHPDERRANVASAFSASAGAGAHLAGEHILLVDDVWTTGATAIACAGVLAAAGARVVSVLTFARVPANPDRIERLRPR